MNKDTPRMTEAWSKASRTADGMYSSRPCHIDIAANCYKEGCEIERELTAVTEQRDRLAEAMQTIIRIYENADKGCIPSSSDMYDEALQSLTNQNEL
jgi:hypothetical protein